MVQEALLKIYARGVVSYFYFSRAPRAGAARALKIRQINSAIFNMDPAARGTIKTPGCISLSEMSTGVTDFCKFIVSIGAGATANSSIVLFS